jgi:uncharacterized membrane protein YdbT with pleckstrin-like domain
MPEQILYQAHPPMFRNHPLGFIVSVLLIAAAVGIIILLVWYVKSRSEQLTITNEELRYQHGILSKTHNELRLSSIRSVRVYQSFFQRMFGTGNVYIFTAGDAPEVTLNGMPDPHQIREIIS